MLIGLSGLAGSGKDFIADVLVEKHKFTKIALADPLKRICKEVFDFSDDQLWGESKKRNEPDKRYFTGKTRDTILDYEDSRFLLTLDKVAEGLEITEPTEKEILEACKIYLTPREALQQLGTNWGRNCYQNVWVDYTLRIAKKLLSGEEYKYNPSYGLYQESIFEIDDSVFTELNNIVISDCRFKNELDAIRAENGKIIRICRNNSTSLQGYASLHSSELEQKEIPDSYFDYVLNNQTDLFLLEEEIISMLKSFDTHQLI